MNLIIIQDKGVRMSKIQKIKMVEFMEEHQDFARGNAHEKTEELWKKLSEILNSSGGSQKSVDQWKRVSQKHKMIY